MKPEHEQRIDKEVEKTLAAFENDIALTENPFLMTQLLARRSSQITRPEGLVSRVGFYRGLAAAILLVNILTIAFWYGSSKQLETQETLVSQLRQEFQVETF